MPPKNLSVSWAGFPQLSLMVLGGQVLCGFPRGMFARVLPCRLGLSHYLDSEEISTSIHEIWKRLPFCRLLAQVSPLWRCYAKFLVARVVYYPKITGTLHFKGSYQILKVGFNWRILLKIFYSINQNQIFILFPLNASRYLRLGVVMAEWLGRGLTHGSPGFETGRRNNPQLLSPDYSPSGFWKINTE